MLQSFDGSRSLSGEELDHFEEKCLQDFSPIMDAFKTAHILI